MFARLSVRHQGALFVAALLMSSVAVGAAIGPGTAQARPLIHVTYA